MVSFLNESGYIKVPLEKIIALDRNGKGLDMIKPLFELVNGRMDLWLEIRERY